MHVRKLLAPFFLGCLCLAGRAYASEGDIGREIGAVLGWRLGPEALEERCREADPAGVEVRAAALKAWQEKNKARLQQVDERVAEILPMLELPAADGDPVHAVREQVKAIFIEHVFSGKNPEQVAALCRAEADPKSVTWNSTGMPHIQMSLAALYDWKVKQEAK
jgi:hypothetical protein